MKILKNILFWSTTVFLLFAILIIAIPKLFGVEFRAVVTGSMTPEIPVGSLVVIVPTKAEDIEIGNDITFIIPDGTAVTHRVIEIDREKNEFTTWGIANDKSAIEAANKYENILGVVRIHIPVLGQIFSWLATLHGKIITVTAILAAYILSYIVGIWTKDKKKQTVALTPPEPTGDSFQNGHFDGFLESFARSEELFKEVRDDSKNAEDTKHIEGIEEEL